jgi:hypothetical protein
MGPDEGNEVFRRFMDHYVWFGWEMIIKGEDAPHPGHPFRDGSNPWLPEDPPGYTQPESAE